MAGLIPQHFIDDLLARIDIVDIIDGYVPLKKAGRNHQACCPFHNEKTPSFTVSQEKQFYHCFGCNANGTAIGFLMEYGGMSFPEAVEDLASRCGLAIPREVGVVEVDNSITELYELMEVLVRFYTQQLREHDDAKHAVEYLKQRGLSGELAKEYEIGFAPPGWDNLLNHLGTSDAARERLDKTGMIIKKEQGGYYDRFRDRIMFPIRDQRGRAIGFGGRVMGDDKPKYLNSPETSLFHKGRELYGLYQSKKADRRPERIFIVEGYMDVLALAQFGVKNAVASLGTAATADHIQHLFKQCSQLVFCFDGDAAGRTAAWRALETALPFMRDGRQCFFMFMPEGDDPDSFIRKHCKDTFINADSHIPLSNYLFSSLQEGFNIETPEGRAAYIDKANPYLKKLPESALKELLIQELAMQTGYDSASLKSKSRVETSKKPISQRKTFQKRGDQSLPPIRKLIRLLLHLPELAEKMDDSTRLNEVKLHGIPFLLDLLAFIQSRNKTTTADILEHWRDTPYEKHLYALFDSEEILEEKELLEIEFKGLISNILKEDEKQLRLRKTQEISSLDDLRKLHSKEDEEEIE